MIPWPSLSMFLSPGCCQLFCACVPGAESKTSWVARPIPMCLLTTSASKETDCRQAAHWEWPFHCPAFPTTHCTWLENMLLGTGCPSHQQTLQQLSSTENSTPAPRSALTWKCKCRQAELLKGLEVKGLKGPKAVICGEALVLIFQW